MRASIIYCISIRCVQCSNRFGSLNRIMNYVLLIYPWHGLQHWAQTSTTTKSEMIFNFYCNYGCEYSNNRILLFSKGINNPSAQCTNTHGTSTNAFSFHKIILNPSGRFGLGKLGLDFAIVNANEWFFFESIWTKVAFVAAYPQSILHSFLAHFDWEWIIIVIEIQNAKQRKSMVIHMQLLFTSLLFSVQWRLSIQMIANFFTHTSARADTEHIHGHIYNQTIIARPETNKKWKTK